MKRWKTKSREPHWSAKEFGFKDPRSRATNGKVVLHGQDMTDLRRQVYKRAGGRCEELKGNGKRCNKYAPWDGFGHGEMSHAKHGANRNDTAETIKWSCRDCHRKRHPGPQFAHQRRQRAEVDLLR